MAQTTEDLQEELSSALRRAETAEYWIERNADFLRERDEFISKDRAMTSDNCAICGERIRYDGHEIAHSCTSGVPALNLLKRDHGLVSISEMNRRIAEAVAAEREACRMAAVGIVLIDPSVCVHCSDRIAAKILERAKC